MQVSWQQLVTCTVFRELRSKQLGAGEHPCLQAGMNPKGTCRVLGARAVHKPRPHAPAEWRRNTEKLSELWASPKARLVPLSGDKVLVQPHRGGGGSRPEGQQQPGAPPPPTLEPVLLQPAAEAAARFVDPAAPHIFLGVDEAGDGAPYFAAQVTDKEALVSALLAQAVAAAGAGPSPTAAETPGAAAGDTGSSSNSSSSSSSEVKHCL